MNFSLNGAIPENLLGNMLELAPQNGTFGKGLWTLGAVEDEDGLNSNSSIDPYIMEMDHPEEMLNPAYINPFFLHIIITHSITFVVGLLGNIFVVTVMIGDRKNRNATNLFLVSLAVSDLLLLLLCVPLETLQYFMVQWNEDGFVCKTTRYVELLSAAANVLTLCAVSLERFIVIVFPMRSRSLCTITNCRRVIFIVWIVALSLSTPVIPAKSGYSVIYRNSTTNVSVKIFYCKEEKSGMSLAIYKFVILFAAPGLLMLICYTYVIRELWRSTRNINLLTNAKSFHGSSRPSAVDSNTTALHPKIRTNLPSGSRVQRGTRNGKNELEVSRSLKTPSFSTRQNKVVQHSRQNKGEDAKKARKQVIKMLILVIILFLICWGPKLVFLIGIEIANTYGFSYFTQEWYFIRVIFNLTPYIHALLNPLIYSFMSKNFRRSTQRQVHRLCLFFGCKCFKWTAGNRNNIPLRPTRTRAMHGVDSSLYSNNYCPISDGPSTRITEIECVSAM